MNLLELAQQLRQQCGVAGNGPASTVGQTGEAKRLIDWTVAAWLEIQGMYDDWGFMREDFSFSTVADQGDYTPTDAGASDLRYWHKNTLRVQDAAIGAADEQWLVNWDYGVFRDTYRFGVQVADRPFVFAIKPKGQSLMLGAIPNKVYTVSGEYQTAPVTLAGNDATPAIPAYLHMVIVYKAMEYYALYESAPEVLARAQSSFSRLMSQLEREELPQVSLGNPLA